MSSGGDSEVPSPCNRHCTLDHEDVCLGCYRTLREILDWRGFCDVSRRSVLERARERRRRDQHAR